MRQDHPMTPGVIDARQQHEPNHPGRRAEDGGYESADMASQAAQGWRDGYAWAKGEGGPEGYVMVPVELKELLASMVKLHESRGTVLTVQMHQLGEMLAAAPQPAVQGEPVGEVRLELGAQPYVFAELYSKSLSILAPGTKLYAAPQPAEQQPAPAVQGEPAEQVVPSGAVDEEFTTGDTYPAGDCDIFEAGIHHKQASGDQWQQRIIVYGDSAADAEALRDRVLASLTAAPIRLTDYEALQVKCEEELFRVRQDRDTHFGEMMRAIKQVDALQAECDALLEALEWLRGAINCTPENDKHQSGVWISTKHPRIKQIDAILAAHQKQEPSHDE